MTSGDDYVLVEKVFRGCGLDSFSIEDAGGYTTIPFSLVHAADEANLRKVKWGERVVFRLVEWKAKKLGLV